MKKFLSVFLAMTMIFSSLIVAPYAAIAAETPLKIGKTVSGKINGFYAYYSFTLESSGTVKFKMSNNSNRIKFQINPVTNNSQLPEITNSNALSTFLQPNSSSYSDSVSYDLMKGTYKIKLTSEDYGEYYTLSSSFSEAQESFETSLDTYTSTPEISNINFDHTYYGFFADLYKGDAIQGNIKTYHQYSFYAESGDLWIKSDNFDFDFAIYDSNNNVEKPVGEYDEYIQYRLSKVGVYTICTKYNSNPQYSFLLTQEIPYPNQKIELEKEYSQTLSDNTSNTQIYELNLREGCLYIDTDVNEEYFNLYTDDGLNIESSLFGDYHKYNINENGKYYLVFKKNKNCNDISYRFSATQTSPFPISNIELKKTYNVDIENSENLYIYSVVAEKGNLWLNSSDNKAFRLYNADKREIEGINEDKYTNYAIPNDGRYYLVLKKDEVENNIITFSFSATQTDPYRALPMSINATTTNYINGCRYDLGSYYSQGKQYIFTIPKSGKVTLKLKNYAPNDIGYDIMAVTNNSILSDKYIYDGNFYYSNILGYIDNQSITLNLMKGTYLISLSGKYNDKFSMTLSFKETKESFPESIDTYKSTVYAKDYSKISLDKTYYGQFAKLTDSDRPIDTDYYAVNLKKGKVWLTYNSTDCSASIGLYNSKSQDIDLKYDASHKAYYYNIPAKGTYYIQIDGEAEYGAYSFKLTQKNPYPAIKKVTLNKTSFVYNGKTQKPTVKVVDSNGDTVSPKYYTVKYYKRRAVSKGIGYYYLTVTFKGKYKAKSYTINGEKWTDCYSADYIIKPKATTVSKLSKKKAKLTVKWKKQSTVNGYQIQYSIDKKFKKNNKTLTISNAKATSKTISKLKKKKTYYVRVRTYKSLDYKSLKMYSSWSKAKKIKM